MEHESLVGNWAFDNCQQLSTKVTGPEITHLRAETEFWEGEAS